MMCHPTHCRCEHGQSLAEKSSTTVDTMTEEIVSDQGEPHVLMLSTHDPGIEALSNTNGTA